MYLGDLENGILLDYDGVTIYDIEGRPLCVDTVAFQNMYLDTLDHTHRSCARSHFTSYS